VKKRRSLSSWFSVRIILNIIFTSIFFFSLLLLMIPTVAILFGVIKKLIFA